MEGGKEGLFSSLAIECPPSDAHINAIFAVIISSLFRLSAAPSAVSTSRRVHHHRPPLGQNALWT